MQIGDLVKPIQNTLTWQSNQNSHGLIIRKVAMTAGRGAIFDILWNDGECKTQTEEWLRTINKEKQA